MVRLLESEPQAGQKRNGFTGRGGGGRSFPLFCFVIASQDKQQIGNAVEIAKYLGIRNQRLAIHGRGPRRRTPGW